VAVITTQHRTAEGDTFQASSYQPNSVIELQRHNGQTIMRIQAAELRRVLDLHSPDREVERLRAALAETERVLTDGRPLTDSVIAARYAVRGMPRPDLEAPTPPPAPVSRDNEPPDDTWVRDRHGALSHRWNGRWGLPGFYYFGQWEAMWDERGPLEVCKPWGAA
jgi:hypothetical protein